MGRQRTIDREKLLEAIFDIVMEQGAAALTIDTVAKKMGISKGGVQYCFNSKEAMIDAMFEHLLSQPGVKIGIVTSRSRDDANENLKSFWWYQKMAIVVTSSDTKQPKPAGEPLEFACEKLGFSANETFYIGDADTDEQAALNAGVDFGGALWGTGSKKNFKSEPLLLDSPEDVNRII